MSEEHARTRLQRELDQVQDKLGPIRHEMDTIVSNADGDELTEGQSRRFSDLERAAEKLQRREHDLREELRAAILEDVQAGGRGLEVVRGHDPGRSPLDEPERTRARDRALDPVRSEGLRAIEREEFSTDDARQRATLLVENDPSGFAARWAAAAADPDYARAFAKLVANPDRGHLEWTEREQAAFSTAQMVQRAMSLTDAAGGYMVPFTLDPAISLTNAGAINPIRDIARNVTTVTDQWAGVSSAGVSAEWKAEEAEAADAAPTLDQPSIPVHLADIFVPFSIEVGQDSVDLLGELRRIMADEKAVHEAAAFTAGTGTGQPTGVVDGLTATETVTTGTAATFVSADVYSLIEALPARFRPRARILAALPVINEVEQMETTNGARLFPGVSETPPTLLRRPLHETSDMDTGTTTTGDDIMLVGDFANYVIVDRIGATLELVPHLFGTNQRPTGQRGAFFYWRVGADHTVVDGFRRLRVG